MEWSRVCYNTMCGGAGWAGVAWCDLGEISEISERADEGQGKGAGQEASCTAAGGNGEL